MCGFGGAKAPKPAPRAPEAPVMAEKPAAAPGGAGGSTGADRRRRAAASQTLLTGARGVESAATTSNKTLLGQ